MDLLFPGEKKLQKLQKKFQGMNSFPSNSFRVFRVKIVKV